MSYSEAGKGSNKRPCSVDYDVYANNWEVVFGKKEVVDFTREDRYIVIKKSDLKYLSLFELQTLTNIQDKIDRERIKQGKSPVNSVVVESDWPEYETVWGMIEERVKSS